MPSMPDSVPSRDLSPNQDVAQNWQRYNLFTLT
jgi:hypothetical protein